MSGIDVRAVTVVLDGTTIIDGVSVVARPGEITGVIGPNGSGKSTLLRTVYRHLKPVAGGVLIGDDDLRDLSPAAAARRIAAMPQERGSDFDVTVRDVVALGRIPHQGGFGRESAVDRDRITTALADAELTALAHRSFASLSGGERQRTLLARCFAQGGEVLVLDEPTNHLDLAHQAQLLTLLKRRSATTLITVHDLNTAAAVCDRLFVLSAGRIVAGGTPAEVLTRDLLDDVFSVHAEVIEHPVTGRLLVAVDYLRDMPGGSPPS
ncbi:ABC transporter related protein OS=Tsukamurella paurometabola (strain ATCC 8368 / DSM / CCUG 35730 / CIP 100753 / JCM 10117 / KCTC 9821 / NBRC 16120 / NCIMB 702349 / NCTC 13040) OX=521096 GN=Tpau_3775 PE=4 SV=1 [Tsukamurella paurometabola]|uniref:ABC transporter related protein n=1 Tax=Tsukamurella paurometabola (strain ATCC 8368 / DSM 20162 / CCUG 35730 / CIP 100753 / JCM 10117 / KCTC 9821 / NBRC 16120 / NCIMB 702349 / NCTC 13040) TaxID=521096 RepID=D5UYQ0_TSUPD|nr:ABC transporter ATP-binding protein [Tsukamurella paurometabola]ADG80353.1 ABC transporter related protein [Tsukamurella paurometabola DSM 20162]SUP39337.1 Iron(3+)-hydroxamate import ATP-binding protein FhuC [Tsukamurella paurometabola]